jgi:hypothetical protein
MSAIGSYAVVSRAKFPLCLEKARNVHDETTGWWIFKTTRVVGVEAFREAWRQALIEEVSFDHSGYVLEDYLSAQRDLNNFTLFDEELEAFGNLCKVFTAAFPFEEPLSPPPLPSDRLLAWCRGEFGDEEAPGLVEALEAADTFYHRGLSAITPERVVVFLIQ